MVYCVYCHTNKINGKKYIGITSQQPERRWNSGKGYVNNEYFFRSIQKYGWDNFTHEILYSELTKPEAEKIEVKLIQKYNSSKPESGYNIELGGNAIGKISDITKSRISAALMRHPCTEETRNKIRKKATGRVSPNKGRKMTQEQIQTNRLSHIGQKPWNKGRPWTDEEKAKCNGKAVMCVETNTIYRTAHEASKECGIDFSSICKCCRNIVKSAGGYHWVYPERNGV